jgi:hypothetical protein
VSCGAESAERLMSQFDTWRLGFPPWFVVVARSAIK